MRHISTPHFYTTVQHHIPAQPSRLSAFTPQQVTSSCHATSWHTTCSHASCRHVTCHATCGTWCQKPGPVVPHAMSCPDAACHMSCASPTYLRTRCTCHMSCAAPAYLRTRCTCHMSCDASAPISSDWANCSAAARMRDMLAQGGSVSRSAPWGGGEGEDDSGGGVKGGGGGLMAAAGCW